MCLTIHSFILKIMGAKTSKGEKKTNKNKNKKNDKNSRPVFGKDLTQEDYDFLIYQTGLSKNDIKLVFDKFNLNNPGN